METDKHDSYQLVFEGPSDDSPDTLRKLKGVFIAELDKSIPEVQEILSSAPLTILESQSETELNGFYQALKSAGGKVLIVAPIAESSAESDTKDITPPEEPSVSKSDEEETELEFSLDELLEPDSAPKTPVEKEPKVHVIEEVENVEQIIPSMVAKPDSELPFPLNDTSVAKSDSLEESAWDESEQSDITGGNVSPPIESEETLPDLSFDEGPASEPVSSQNEETNSQPKQMTPTTESTELSLDLEPPAQEQNTAPQAVEEPEISLSPSTLEPTSGENFDLSLEIDDAETTVKTTDEQSEKADDTQPDTASLKEVSLAFDLEKVEPEQPAAEVVSPTIQEPEPTPGASTKQTPVDESPSLTLGLDDAEPTVETDQVPPEEVSAAEPGTVNLSEVSLAFHQTESDTEQIPAEEAPQAIDDTPQAEVVPVVKSQSEVDSVEEEATGLAPALMKHQDLDREDVPAEPLFQFDDAEDASIAAPAPKEIPAAPPKLSAEVDSPQISLETDSGAEEIDSAASIEATLARLEEIVDEELPSEELTSSAPIPETHEPVIEELEVSPAEQTSAPEPLREDYADIDEDLPIDDADDKIDDEEDGERWKPRRKSQTGAGKKGNGKKLAFLGFAAILITGNVALAYLNFGGDEDSSRLSNEEMADYLTVSIEAEKKKKAIQKKKEKEALAAESLNPDPTEIIGKQSTEGLSASWKIVRKRDALVTGSFKFSMPPSAELSAEQIVHGESRSPWIPKLESPDIELTQNEDGTFRGTGPAKVYVETEKGRNRTVGQASMVVQYLPEVGQLSGSVIVQNGYDNPPEDGTIQLETLDDGSYRFWLQAEITYLRSEAAAQAAENKPVEGAKKDDANPPSPAKTK